MNLQKKIDYNRSESAHFGWGPGLFGASDYNSDLIEKIEDFQRLNGLMVDGLCGPATYRRKITDIEHKDAEYIVHNGESYPIHWDKVVLWDEAGGITAKKGCYRSNAGKKKRKPSYFINHWDVCLSSRSCQRVLDKRRLSVHFLIDNDGTIYQCCDTQATAFHCGRGHNEKSIGVEVSTAYNLKYQNWYQRKGFGPRPIWSGVKVHGKELSPFLGLYEVQINALAALWEATSRSCDIPLQIPQTRQTVDVPLLQGRWSGYACHYHVTRGKIDISGLSLSNVLQRAQTIRKQYQ